MALHAISNPGQPVALSGRTSPDLDTISMNGAPPSLQSTTSSSASSIGRASAGFTGDTFKRFVIVSTLLSLIDPVRGEPTTHSLDRHHHDDSWKLDLLQKKFLDSFAFISSTSRQGKDTASAVCLEQGHPSGTTLRLARNRGVPSELVGKLQAVLDDLTAVASGGILTQVHISLKTGR